MIKAQSYSPDNQNSHSKTNPIANMNNQINKSEDWKRKTYLIRTDPENVERLLIEAYAANNHFLIGFASVFKRALGSKRWVKKIINIFTPIAAESNEIKTIETNLVEKAICEASSNHRLKLALADVLLPMVASFKNMHHLVFETGTYFPAFSMDDPAQRFLADVYDGMSSTKKACRV